MSHPRWFRARRDEFGGGKLSRTKILGESERLADEASFQTGHRRTGSAESDYAAAFLKPSRGTRATFARRAPYGQAAGGGQGRAVARSTEHEERCRRGRSAGR